MAALKMFGHPKIYQCMSELVLEINALPNGDNATQQERLMRCALKFEEFATNMRKEVNRLLCGQEEMQV